MHTCSFPNILECHFVEIGPLPSGVNHFDIKHYHLIAHNLDSFSLEAGNNLLEQINVANIVCSPSISSICNSVVPKSKCTIKCERRWLTGLQQVVMKSVSLHSGTLKQLIVELYIKSWCSDRYAQYAHHLKRCH